MESLLRLIERLTPKAFNTFSHIAVVVWELFGVSLLVVFIDIEVNESRFDFHCAKLNDNEQQAECYDQYEKRYNKLNIPVLAFVIVNFSVILIVCLIYGLCVKSTVNELEKPNGNRDVEGEGTSLIQPSESLAVSPSKSLFMAYCCQLFLRFTLAILFIILQIQFLYPGSFPSNFACNLGEAINNDKGSSSNSTQTYKCHDQRANKKTFWIDAVAVVSGILAFLVLVEILFIFSRARNGKTFMENKQFYSDHLKSYLRRDSRDNPDAPPNGAEIAPTPGKYRPKRSAHFLNTLEKAKTEKDLIKRNNQPSQSQQSVHRQSFYIVDRDDQREPYRVEVSTDPSCTCQDYKNYPTDKQLCKHIIWVYLYVLHVEETSSLLQQVSLYADEVVEILSAKDAKGILSQDNRYDLELQWYLHKREENERRENPFCEARRCTNGRCKGRMCRGRKNGQGIVLGNLCFVVKGLRVSADKKSVEESSFYFGPSGACVQQFPLNSNLKYPTKVFRGRDVSDRELEIVQKVASRVGRPRFAFN